MVDLADLRISRPRPPKLSAADKRIQSIVKDIEVIKFLRTKYKRRASKVLKMCEKLIYYVVQCIDKSKSDHLLQTTVIWALTTIFRMYPVEVKELMLRAGVPRILYEILSEDILQGSSRQYASELCFFLSTDSSQYMFKKVGEDLKPVFQGVSGPLPSLPEIARTFKFDNMKKVLRSGQYIQHVDALEMEDQNSSNSVSLTGIGASPERVAVKKALNPITEVRRAGDNSDEETDSDEETFISDVSTNVFDKFTNASFIPYRIDEHNLNKIEALFHGKKEQDLVSLPSMKFLSNFGFETAVEEQAVLDSEKGNADDKYFTDINDERSVGSSISSDSRSRVFSVMSDYDLGTSSYSAIHQFSKTAPPMLGNNDIYKKMVPAAPIGDNLAVLTASAAAYVANLKASSDHDERVARTAPIMHPNVHYTEVSRAATAQGSATANLFRIGSNSPRLPPIQPRSMLTNGITMEDSVEEPASGLQMKSSSVSFDVPLSSPSAVYDELERLQAQLRDADANAKRQSESIDDFLDALDPLALSGLNSTNKNISFKSSAAVTSPIEEGDEEDEDSSAIELDESGTMIDSNGVELDTTNPFIARKLERIRAEKLVDHAFMKRVLSKSVTISETQTLVERIESILKLVDAQDSGFVTWESFARVLLAVAPPKLLRDDVVQFMQSQTDSDQNLVDYREFIISGKVMIVDRHRKESGDLPRLYVKGWLERQKQYSGESSTLTWKAHVEWYQKRKANAIVWLMRRATRAMRQTLRLEEADKFLRVLGKRSKVLAELLEIGAKVVVTGAQRVEARRNMLLRCLRARRQLIVMDETHTYLKRVAAAAWLQLETIAKLKAEEIERKRFEADAASNKRAVTASGKIKQADIAVVYKIAKLQSMAIEFLLKRAKRAIQHHLKQQATFQQICIHAGKAKLHTERQAKAFLRLKVTAMKAVDWCSVQDRVLQSLINLGKNFESYLKRRDEALTYLLRLGRNSLAAAKRIELVGEELRRLGQGKLRWLNAQAEAVAYLSRRNILATRLLARQKEAIEFLRAQSRGIFENEINLQKAQLWLQQVGQRAVRHRKNQLAAVTRLQFIAKKATFLVRRSTIAVTDLCQIGQQARFRRFEFQYHSDPQKLQQIKSEKDKLMRLEKKKAKERLPLPSYERWRLELLEAFNFIAGSLTPPVIEDRQDVRDGKLGNPQLVLGRIGFRKLVAFGKIFGAKEDVQALDEYFKTMDPLCHCLIPFEPIWDWFLRRAEIRDKYLFKQKKKPFSFSVNDVLSLEERAVMILFQRHGNDVDPQLGSLISSYVPPKKAKEGNESDSESVKKRRRAKNDAWDDSVEGDGHRRHEIDSDSDEDSLGDFDADHGDKDIGKLMRYLTRRDQARKEEKEREEKERQEKEEQEKQQYLASLLDASNVDGKSPEELVVDSSEAQPIDEDSPIHQKDVS